VGIINPGNIERFAIWESKKQASHLLIVYGAQLTDDWKQRFGINGITESEFQSSFKPKIKEHRIHGYNEFNQNKKFLSFLF